MKKVIIEVYVLHISQDGDDTIYVYQTRQQCIDHMYERVENDWTDTFGDDGDDIEDYEKEEAISHYYEYGDSGYYSIYKEAVEYSMMDLQDRIAKSMGVSHG